MEHSDFDERERLLMGEVARRLEPRLPEILRAWTAAIPLVAPPDKIPGMRRTLVALTKEFVDSFFPALIAGGPQLALTAYIEFAEQLMRRRPPATASNQRLTIADMMRAARVLREVVDGEITLAFDNDGTDESSARLAVRQHRLSSRTPEDCAVAAHGQHSKGMPVVDQTAGHHDRTHLTVDQVIWGRHTIFDGACKRQHLKRRTRLIRRAHSKVFARVVRKFARIVRIENGPVRYS